ncbi:hypothetical protein G3T14_04930 [Methylobacterium sp. BTF04]|uniref:WcbI family polysaccharide biosynthesis putative acetyltransferase n=1 Tax=Methylobacterium sp. BTF04 TaxID=2708300 RepID=UPI0013D7138C|nr:WcbI family polysaccharide biosynthesis putative acetyltransferase [Methylobacterium sp. BTF04]NEU11470.1 hypothetical protein [Methylobacterium sp. BTF04]
MRSWAGAWRRRPPDDGSAPKRTGARIAVIGNCQADGIAQSLRLLLPDAAVSLLPVASLARNHGSLDRLTDHLIGFDHVFSQFFPEGFVEGGNVHALAAGDSRFRLFPTILFPGFHPDMVHVGDVEALSAARLVSSPVGPYHSAIALCAYLEGLDVDATVALFRDAVFARLGYYAAWDDATTYLLGSARDLAFPLDRDFALWTRRGCFMHVLNHPKLFVLGDVARRLAIEAGLAPLPVAVEDYLADELAADAVWPLYPEIAARYGLRGATLFKRKGRPGAVPVLFDLPAFVAASFAIYACYRVEALACGRVEAWRQSEAVRALFHGADTAA